MSKKKLEVEPVAADDPDLANPVTEESASAEPPSPDSVAEAVKAEPRDPEQIQAEIEQTRAELGETVAQLAEKADVKAQAKKKIDETTAGAQEKVASATGTAKAKAWEYSARAQDATPDSAQAAAQQAARSARENPIPAALGAFALAFLIGWLLRRRSQG